MKTLWPAATAGVDVRSALRSQLSQEPATQAVMQQEIRVGRYETVALPLFGLGSIDATIDPGLDNSILSIGKYHIYERRNRMRVVFQFTDPGANEKKSRRLTAEIVSVVDFVWPDRSHERLIAIQGHIVLGSRLSCCDLYLTRKRVRSTRLVLGKSFIGPNMSVDAGSAFIAGHPDHPLIDPAPG